MSDRIFVDTNILVYAHDLSAGDRHAKALAVIESLNYLAWPVQNNDPETTIRASEIEEKNSLSFWDALIVAAALRMQAQKIITEDLNHGQIIEGILVENPLI